MEYLQFDKTQIDNLEYSLPKEYLITNRKGTYSSSTIINCNTRKYHGLFICKLNQIDSERHLLLSAVDETLLVNGKTFHLASRKYPNSIHSGYKYLHSFSLNPIPTFVYKIDELILQKEILLVSNEEQVMIKYTVLESEAATTLMLHPFLANRNIHHIQKVNTSASTDYQDISNGIKTKMYEEYPYLFMQTTPKSEYSHKPDWFYNVVHEEEIFRGYESNEDLLVPGYFEISLKKGESTILSVSLKEQKTSGLKRKFNTELNKLKVCKTLEDHLINSANQFIVEDDKNTSILAGFHWFGVEMRDTFISLPGIFLSNNDNKTVTSVLKSASKNLRNGLFRTQRGTEHFTNNEADTPLWYIWAVQQYAEYTKKHKSLWKDFGSKIVSILDNFKKGTDYSIGMHENGLIYSAQEGCALSWMNASTQYGPVTERSGYAVEINALWYNAISFAIELAEKSDDKKFVKKWSKYPKMIKKSFVETFWDEDKKYLADYVTQNYKNFDLRPNQIIAVSLPYSMLNQEMAKRITNIVKEKLLTNRGLRSLSADSVQYNGVYEGNHDEREIDCHQGTVHPWLLTNFAEAYLKTNKKSAKKLLSQIYKGFEEEITNAGLGSISEIYDGDEPHSAKGAISQAKSVAELIRLKYIIDNNF